MNRKQEDSSQSHSSLDGFTQAKADGEEKGDYFWTHHLFLAEEYVRQDCRATTRELRPSYLHQHPLKHIKYSSLPENNYTLCMMCMERVEPECA
jgi:hypothetical protein